MTQLDMIPTGSPGGISQWSWKSHLVDYIKMVEEFNGAAHAKIAFWPLEASILLYGYITPKAPHCTRDVLWKPNEGAVRSEQILLCLFLAVP
jgi:hypothetical protein